ncbi:hypothetical protein AB0C02_32790 [Micromonospora sp. NPDC048999]|uniref:hypothetical protein n=1 Tax=Micromonospora sp. NPDC048999 TaxID=3155391 RepID=UPI0033F95BBD
MAGYGRSDEEWDQLTSVGLEFLVERARLEKTTTYTELDATLRRRTGIRGFDFEQDSERAAMGHLLGLIVERNHPTTNLLISALVQYLNTNDAGPGFYALAGELGMLPRRSSAMAKQAFWIGQLNALYVYYAARRPGS